jgi:acyl carrier protein
MENTMLPEVVLNFLNDAAAQARVELPDRDSSLFQSGVLDSFSLVDFVTLLEAECSIKIDDTDLRPQNFDTIAKVERFVERAKAAA